jgi:hypothetical protein
MPAYDLSTSASPPCPFGPSLTGSGWLALTTIGCLHGCYPCLAVLDGIPGPVPGYRLLTHALLGPVVNRFRVGHAVTGFTS